MKVVILCGGVGSRLAEETKLIPKPMVKIGKIPIVQHIINYYKYFGLEEFILATGYKKDIIERYYKKNKSVQTIYTGKKTLTGGRLLRLKKYFKKNEFFLLTYGDGLSNLDINKLIIFHKKHNKIATLTAVRPAARFGELKISGNKVRKFQEKQQFNSNWINGGFFIFNSKIFNYISGDNIMLEREPFKELTKANQLMAYKHSGFWQCMDTLRDKILLSKLWKEKKAPWKKNQKN